jgi:hypothetical protein
MLQNQQLCATNGTAESAPRRAIYETMTLIDPRSRTPQIRNEPKTYTLVVGRSIFTLTIGRAVGAVLLDLLEPPARPYRVGGRKARTTGGHHADEFHLS